MLPLRKTQMSSYLHNKTVRKPHHPRTATSGKPLSRKATQHTHESAALKLARILPLRKTQTPRHLAYNPDKPYQSRNVTSGKSLSRNLLQHKHEFETSELPHILPLRKPHPPKPLQYRSQSKPHLPHIVT